VQIAISTKVAERARAGQWNPQRRHQSPFPGMRDPARALIQRLADYQPAGSVRGSKITTAVSRDRSAAYWSRFLS
jgi:hypothetical protein